VGKTLEFEKGHRHRLCSAHVTTRFASEKKGSRMATSGSTWRYKGVRAGDGGMYARFDAPEQEFGGTCLAYEL